VDTAPWLVTVKRFSQSLTLMWLTLGSLVAVTAVSGLRSHGELGHHPYAHKAPVGMRGEQRVLTIAAGAVVRHRPLHLITDRPHRPGCPTEEQP